MNYSGFKASSKCFIDTQHYPRGFRKSGDFSIAEADILTQLGHRLKLLASAEAIAESDEEQQFVSVVHGVSCANSKIEKAWMKYSRLANHPRKFYTLNSRKLADTEDYSDDNDSVNDIEELEIG